MFARDFSAGGYLQVQVRVAEVDFADGTRWRAEEGVAQTLFDDSLFEADSGKCHDAERVAKALTYIKQTKFDLNLEREKPGADTRVVGIPRLSFACTLEESKAVCPGRP
jgi:hypothetical protein